MRVSSVIIAALLGASCTGLKPGSVELVDTGPSDSETPAVTDSGGGGTVDDADGDGHGADEDCDDTDAAVNSDATEICDGIDNDCNGKTDEEDPYLDRDTMSEWSEDVDGDGYGGEGSILKSCVAPDGYSLSGDCDDADTSVNPAATEICDGIDNDCDDLVDDEAEGAIFGYPDEDADGFGEDTDQTWACGGVENNWDCDDADSTEPQVVDMTAAAGGNGSAALPWQRIQDGVDAADRCVLVYGGTYDESVDFGGKALRLTGLEGSGKTTIDATDADNAAVIIDTVSGVAELSGFTITGGTGYLDATSTSTSCGSTTICTDYYNTYCGGGVYINGAAVTMDDLVVDGNSLPSTSTTESGNDTYYTYSFGGGICAMGATLELDDVDLSDNYADQGGGLYVDESSTVQHTRSWVVSNRATDGAGYAVDGGSLTLSNVGIVWGLASSEGGGLFASDGTVDLMNVTFGENDAPAGGGISATGANRLLLSSSVIYGSNTGEGVYADSTATVLATYSDVYGNSLGAYTGMTDPTGSNGNISEDPDFTSVTPNGNPDDDDWHIKITSPCIDGGDPSATYYDVDGTPNDQGASGGPFGDWF